MVKIVVTGPESSGKSWLCEQLSKHYQVPWVPEYARQYLEEHGPAYDFDLLDQLWQQHLIFQKTRLEKCDSALTFLDTDLINYLVWEQLVFGKVHPTLQRAAQQEEGDHRYLLMAADLPWKEDRLRENPSGGERIFKAHQQAIEQLQRPYRVVRGKGKERLLNAIAAVEELLAHK